MHSQWGREAQLVVFQSRQVPSVVWSLEKGDTGVFNGHSICSETCAKDL